MYTDENLKSLGEFFEIDFTKKLKPRLIKKDTSKDLLIADVHIPFHHRQLFEKTIEDNLDCENLWIIGDWWDMYAKSHYRKQMSIDFKTEYREGFYILREVASKFNKVFLMLSNHDLRFKKWVFDNVPSDLINFVDYDMPEKLIACIPNVEIKKQRVERSREIGYIYQNKNMIVSHVELGRKDVSKSVQDITKEFFRWEGNFKLKPYNMVLQAHNHQSAKVRFGDKWLFQIPCLIDIRQPAFDYVYSGKLYGNPPALGYVVLKKNDVFDPKASYIVDY